MIELKDVSYGYEKKHPIIKNVNKTIQPRSIYLCDWEKWFTENRPWQS